MKRVGNTVNVKRQYLFLLLCLWANQVFAEPATLSFCFEEWQPYAYTNENGESVGHDINYLSNKLKQAQLAYRFVELPFPLCKQQVLSGKIDFILHVDETDDLALLSQPLSNWQLTFAISENNPMTYEQLVQNQGVKILMARNYSYPQALLDALAQMEANIIKVSYYTGELAALKRLFYRLEIGQAQAMLVDKIWAQDMVKKHQLPIKVFEQVIYQVPQFIGFNKKNITQAKRLELALH